MCICYVVMMLCICLHLKDYSGIYGNIGPLDWQPLRIAHGWDVPSLSLGSRSCRRNCNVERGADVNDWLLLTPDASWKIFSLHVCACVWFDVALAPGSCGSYVYDSWHQTPTCAGARIGPWRSISWRAGSALGIETRQRHAKTKGLRAWSNHNTCLWVAACGAFQETSSASLIGRQKKTMMTI